MAFDSSISSSLPFSPLPSLRTNLHRKLPYKISPFASPHGDGPCISRPSSSSDETLAFRTLSFQQSKEYRICPTPVLTEHDRTGETLSLPWTQLASRLLPAPVQGASAEEIINSVDVDTPIQHNWIPIWSLYNLSDVGEDEDHSLLVVDNDYFRTFYGFSAPAPAIEATKQQGEPGKQDFHINIGYAIRTLREELPSMFYKELSYDIYREDIVLRDPMNNIRGINNYKLIFRALRFHGRMFFKALWVDILRIWQPSDNVIMVRWQVRGIPRVPWEAQGIFDGTSEYKLDKEGKIYEHKVDNVAPTARPKFKIPTVAELLNVQPCPSTPTFYEKVRDAFVVIMPYLLQFSWIRFYLALKGTVDVHQNPHMMG